MQVVYTYFEQDDIDFGTSIQPDQQVDRSDAHRQQTASEGKSGIEAKAPAGFGHSDISRAANIQCEVRHANKHSV